VSGFGGAFAAAIIGLIFTMAFSAVTKLYVNDLAIHSIDAERVPALSLPSVGTGEINSTYVFLVNVTMDGGKSIRCDSLYLSDVFVVYYSSGTKLTKRVEMGSGTDEWSIRRVLVGDREGELVNPLDAVSHTGMWDPGETLELNITTSMPIDVNLWYFSMTVVDGGTCSKTFG